MIQIKPIERAKLFEMLAAEIEEWVLSGKLKPGDRLPAEATLATKFQVSRPVVREGLARLRERGLVGTVNGSGNFVSYPETSRLAEMMGRHLQLMDTADTSISNLYEARLAIETVAAGLAATRASAEDLAQMREHLAAMKKNARTDLAQWADADVRFHLAVATASHNPFLATLLSPLVEVLRLGILGVHENAEAVRLGLNAHEAILTALEARQEQAATEAMRKHLLESRSYALKVFVSDRKTGQKVKPTRGRTKKVSPAG